MKRLFRVLLSFVLVFVLLTPITCFATELAAEGVEVSYHTIFTRLWEFVEENKTEVVSAIGSGLVLLASAVVKGVNSKENKKLTDALSVIRNDTAGTTKAQGSIIGVINQMITGNNTMTEKFDKMYKAYEENQTIENDRNRLLGAMMVEVTAILEMISSVYVHNKNLPQGIKDLCILQYANVQKAISDDTLLCAIVESVREKVNFEELSDASEETVEEAVN